MATFGAKDSSLNILSHAGVGGFVREPVLTVVLLSSVVLCCLLSSFVVLCCPLWLSCCSLLSGEKGASEPVLLQESHKKLYSTGKSASKMATFGAPIFLGKTCLDSSSVVLSSVVLCCPLLSSVVFLLSFVVLCWLGKKALRTSTIAREPQKGPLRR